MKLKGYFLEETILIRYYNVLFFLLFNKMTDEYKIRQIQKRIKDGEVMNMRTLAAWCHCQNIPFSTKFIYRPDFSLQENLWNLYSYCRFLIENKKLKGCETGRMQ